MGQQLMCGSTSDSFINDGRFTIVQQFRGTENRRQSFINVCKEFGIGQYMDHNSNQKVDKMWKELYGITQILRIQKDEHNYTELKQDIKKKYNFVVNSQDEIITSLWILDKKGFNYIVSLGPPAEYRWSCWKIILLTFPIIQISYEDQLCQINESTTQIGYDVKRTLVTHQFFKQSEIGKQQLVRMLNAIALTFPTLGYCQGMNFLAGFLLLVSGCDERLGFECFLQMLISPKYLFYYLFCEKLPFLQLLTYFCHEQIKYYDLEVYNHLQEHQIPDSFWLTKMILSIFLYILPINQCIRMWDYVLSNGCVSIIELIVALVHTIREEILSSDIEKIGTIFQGQLNKKEIDVEGTISLARMKFVLDKKRVAQLSREFLSQKKSYDRSSNEYKFWRIFQNYDKKRMFQSQMNEFINKSNL